ncbi:MAG: hypothetical protein GY940_07355 [bacterium]|nr:hypothetical protein [bacterium]
MSRELSSVEHVLYLIDQEASLSFVMVARGSGDLSKPVLRQALDMVQEKHPPLRWRIQERDGKSPIFATTGVPRIPLRIVKRKDDRHWVEVAEDEMNGTFPWDTGPLMRVVMLEGPGHCDLLFNCCHIASDAASGVTVVRDTLTFAGKLSRGEAIDPVQSLHEPPSSLGALKKDLEYPPEPSEAADSSGTDQHKTVELTPNIDIPPEQAVTRIIPGILPKDYTKKLVARCREEKTSVHGALCAAYFQAVVEFSQRNRDKKEPRMIGCISPVDMRPHFSVPPGDDIGYYICFGVHNQLIDTGENAFWSAARTVKESLMIEIKYGRDIAATRGVGGLLESKDTGLRMVRDGVSANPPTIATNMGRVNIPDQYGDLKLEELHFPVAIHGLSVTTIAVTTFHGRMVINFLYSSPFFSKEEGQMMADSMMKRLKNALQ